MYTPSSKDSKSLLGRAAHKHSEVRQRSLRSAQSQRAKGLTPPVHVGSFDDNDDTVLLGTADEFLYDSWNGFVGGDFASGKIRHIQTDGSCWALAYSKRADMLAVGLPDGRVDILETSHYTTLCRIEPGGGGRGDGSGGSSGGVRYRGKISAIEWCPHAQTLGGTVQDGGELVAIADLEGNVSLYRIDITRVEFEGLQLLYEFEVGAQVRCMALKRFLVPNDKEIKNVLVLTVGDTNGRITICTLDCQVDITASMVTMEVLNDKILGLDVHPEKMILVYGTKDGWVVVRNLEWQYINHWQVVCSDNIVWKTARNGQVRAVKMTDDGSYALFGGYDKRLCVYDSKLFAVIQEMPLDGTINTIALDPLDRYYVVGCRDKSLTLFDTSTFKPVKQFPTPGWVTSISWGVPGVLVDVVAVRSETEGITLFDMTPVHLMDRSLSGDEKSDASSVSWSPDGTYLARLVGNSIRIANSSYAFRRTCDMHIRNGALRCIQFSPVFEEHREGKDDKEQEASFLASVGLDGYLRLFRFVAPGSLELVQSTYVENDLWVVAWSSDGNQLAVGGKGKTVYLYDAPSLALKVKKLFQGRIWDLAFKPLTSFRVNDEMSDNESTMQAVGYDLAVGSGEYKALLFDQDLSCPALEITRHRTVRCIDYHPSLPNLAVGDGSGTVIVVNYRHEETLVEVYVGGRVNVLRFSPCGDFLLVCTDNSMFFLYETKTYKVVQEFECNGFAVAGSFSSSGRYLALGNSIDAYMIVKLGPLLGIDHLPLTKDLPIWALQESLFRSGYGPSLIQRYMISGKQTGMKWVAATFKQYPDAVYTFDRHRGEDCFATALRCREIKLLQLAITTVVDGSLDAENDRQSILTTKIPERARLTIQVMVESHPPEYTVAILNALTFIKVPFTRQHLLRNDKRMTCARSSYVDPWDRFPFKESVEDDADYTVRTSAVLPIPGLGTMNFLSWLVARAPAEAFDNEAMAVVLKVMWRNHIQKYFLLDMIFYISYYTVWIFLIDLNWRKYTAALAIALMVMNTALLCREILQSNLRWNYFISGWNQIDLVAIGLVYGHTIPASTNQNVDNQVPLSVVTTLLLTMVSFPILVLKIYFDLFFLTSTFCIFYFVLPLAETSVLSSRIPCNKLAGDCSRSEFLRCARLSACPLYSFGGFCSMFPTPFSRRRDLSYRT